MCFGVFLLRATKTFEKQQHQGAIQIENTIGTFLELLSFSIELNHFFSFFFRLRVCVHSFFILTVGLFPICVYKMSVLFVYSIPFKINR